MSHARITISLKSDCPQWKLNLAAKHIWRVEMNWAMDKQHYVSGFQDLITFDWNATLTLPKRKKRK